MINKNGGDITVRIYTKSNDRIEREIIRVKMTV